MGRFDFPSPVLRTASPRGGEEGAGPSASPPIERAEMAHGAAPSSPLRGEAVRRTGEGKSKNPVTRRREGKTDFARKLRKESTEEELRLWSDLRGRRLNGWKFTRQIPLGPYIVDFLCRDAHLVIELDGIQHVESHQDAARTRWLNRNSYSVLRFWNDEVRWEAAAVWDTIAAVLDGRIREACGTIRFSPADSPSPVLRTASPRRGEAGAAPWSHSALSQIKVSENRAPSSPLRGEAVRRTGEGESISGRVSGRS